MFCETLFKMQFCFITLVMIFLTEYACVRHCLIIYELFNPWEKLIMETKCVYNYYLYNGKHF